MQLNMMQVSNRDFFIKCMLFCASIVITVLTTIIPSRRAEIPHGRKPILNSRLTTDDWGNDHGLRMKLCSIKCIWTLTWQADASWLSETSSRLILWLLPHHPHNNVLKQICCGLHCFAQQYNKLWGTVPFNLTQWWCNLVQCWKSDDPFSVTELCSHKIPYHYINGITRKFYNFFVDLFLESGWVSLRQWFSNCGKYVSFVVLGVLPGEMALKFLHRIKTTENYRNSVNAANYTQISLIKKYLNRNVSLIISQLILNSLRNRFFFKVSVPCA